MALPTEIRPYLGVSDPLTSEQIEALRLPVLQQKGRSGYVNGETKKVADTRQTQEGER